MIKISDQIKQAGSISPIPGKTISKMELLEAFLNAAEKAWLEAIQPRIKAIRQGNVNKSSMKGGGTDFFTEADTASEEIIRQEIVSRFGENTFRIFGEEKNIYVGNQEAGVSIRVDPIDGTEAFKFGKATWSIMIGAYSGRGKSERQIIGMAFWPEYYNEAAYYVDGAGVFISNFTTGETTQIDHLDNQDSLGDIIIAFWKNSNLNKRGKIDSILQKLEEAGARVRGKSPAETREALLTYGKRAMIMDGDFNQVDFIPYTMLVKLGYKVYDWDGVEYSIDDPDLTDRKIVIIPPGKAGKNILNTIKSA